MQPGATSTWVQVQGVTGCTGYSVTTVITNISINVNANIIIIINANNNAVIIINVNNIAIIIITINIIINNNSTNSNNFHGRSGP